MTLHQLTIIASPDAEPILLNTYTWKDGGDLQELESAIFALEEYLTRRRDALATALASQQPINPS